MFLPKESTRTPFCHRGDRLIITARWEKGRGRHFFCQMKDNFPMPYFTVVEGCQAGGLGHLLQYMREYNAETGQQKVQLSIKMKHFAHLGT